MLEVQSLNKPTPIHQPTAKRRRLRLTSVPLVDLRALQREDTLDDVDLYRSLNSLPKSLMSDVDSLSISNKVCLYNEELKENSKLSTNGEVELSDNFSIQVSSNGKSWVVQRSYENFHMLDRQLHQCVYDRKFSALPQILMRDLKVEEECYGVDNDDNNKQDVRQAAKKAVATTLSEYLHRFSDIAGNLISCGPILNWLELDNRGNRLIVTDDSAINTPAVAAAYVTKRYIAQAGDEISFEVGDMISVIDMPPSDESIWWRGKRGFEVGFFPSECVEVIGDKVPHTIHIPKAPTKPILRKHGKLIAFFRSFILSRPSRRKLKQSGILRERVFGCDLGEHLLNSRHDIPMVLKCCADFIEVHGIVDGIYRLSGVTSNIQKLRNTFDEDRVPNLNDEAILQDIHSVASLLKMYFRELPNPLLTYQLYDKFVAAVQSDEEIRLLSVRDIVQQMPPPHYRSKDLEVGGVAALQVVGVQAVVTEFLIHYSDLIFNDKMPIFFPIQGATGGSLKRNRPKSLAISTPTKLLSLEEARSRALGTMPGCQFSQKYIEVGGGPATLPSKYHTIIELPDSKGGSTKSKKSPSGWKSFFSSKGRSSSQCSHYCEKQFRKTSTTPSDPGLSFSLKDNATTEVDISRNISHLRSVKSAESLISCAVSSHHNSDLMDSTIGIVTSVADIGNPSVFAITDDNFKERPSSSLLLAVQPTLQRHSPHSHHRSVSHDSYFEFSLDRRRVEHSSAELSTILSEDYEDGDAPILSASDYADICFADQEREPDIGDIGEFVTTTDSKKTCSSAMDTNNRISIDFEDVPCDIVGDIQHEVAVALHWDQDTLSKRNSHEDDREGRDDEQPSIMASESEGGFYEDSGDHHQKQEMCLNYSVDSYETVSENQQIPCALAKKPHCVISSSAVASPSISLSMGCLDIPDLADMLFVPDSLGIITDSIDQCDEEFPLQFIEFHVKGASHNTQDDSDTNAQIIIEEVVPNIHITTIPVTVDEVDVKMASETFQVDSLVAGTTLDVLVSSSELTESDSSISHNVSSLCASSSSASLVNEEIYDAFAYSVLTNEEGIISPVLNKKSPLLVENFEEAHVNILKCISSEEPVHRISSFENKENDVILAVDFSSSAVSTCRVDNSSKSEASYTELTNESPISNSSMSTSNKISPVEESKRKFECEIGRHILRERKMKLELEKIQLETQHLNVHCGIISSLEENLPVCWKQSVNSECAESEFNEVRLRRVTNLYADEEQNSNQLKQSVSSVCTNAGTASSELKHHPESMVPKCSPSKPGHPERKASVRELMSRFENGKSSVALAEAKQVTDALEVSRTEVLIILPVRKNTKSTGTPSTPPTENPFSLDYKLLTSSIMPIVEAENCHESTLNTSKKMLDVQFSSHEQLSKSASGKLETYGSEFSSPTDVHVTSPLISFSQSLACKESPIDKCMSTDPARRQRIDRYKEERRAQLRERICSESFKSEHDCHSNYLSRLKQKIVSPTKQFDSAIGMTEEKGSFSSPRKHGRFSAGSPLGEKTINEGLLTRRLSAHVQQDSVEPICTSKFVQPVSPLKTSKDVHFQLNTPMNISDKALSLVESNTRKWISEPNWHTSHANNQTKDVLLDHHKYVSLHKITAPQKDSFPIEIKSEKQKSIAVEKVHMDSANLLSSQKEVKVPTPPSPSSPRKIKDVAAYFDQPTVTLERQFSGDISKVMKSKISSAPSSWKANFPSGS